MWYPSAKAQSTHCCVFPSATRSSKGSPEAKSARVRPSSNLGKRRAEVDEDAAVEDEGSVATAVASDRTCLGSDDEAWTMRLVTSMAGEGGSVMRGS